jgi:hypothetical protein
VLSSSDATATPRLAKEKPRYAGINYANDREICFPQSPALQLQEIGEVLKDQIKDVNAFLFEIPKSLKCLFLAKKRRNSEVHQLLMKNLTLFLIIPHQTRQKHFLCYSG